MEFGMSLPLGGPIDPAELKDTAQALDGAGVNFVTLAGHMLSAEPGRFPDRPEGTYAGVYLDPLTADFELAADALEPDYRATVWPALSAAIHQEAWLFTSSPWIST